MVYAFDSLEVLDLAVTHVRRKNQEIYDVENVAFLVEDRRAALHDRLLDNLGFYAVFVLEVLKHVLVVDVELVRVFVQVVRKVVDVASALNRVRNVAETLVPIKVHFVVVLHVAH